MSASLPVTPHGFPCRLVDVVGDGGSGRVARVTVTGNAFLTSERVWPVTLLAEAMAQSILLLDPPEDMDALRLVGLHDVVAHQAVVPGDCLEVEVELAAVLGRLRRYRCRARRAGALAASAEITVSS